MPTIASAMARGTVRAVSRTSPLGTRAHSIPANAKISSSDVRATSPAEGMAAIRRLSVSMKKSPPIATSSSGSSFATVAIEFSRTPSDTPRRLISVQNPNATTRMPISIMRPASAGTSSPRLAAKTVDTAAVANVPNIHRSTPDRKPANGPKAVPM